MSCCTFFTVDAATPTMKDFLGTRVEGKGEAREASPSYRQDGPDGCWWYSGRALVVVCLSVCSQSNVGFLWWVCYCAVLPQACQHRAYSYWETDTQISRRHLATAAAWCGERYYNSQLWVSLLVWQQWGSASKPCGCVWVCVLERRPSLSLSLSHDAAIPPQPPPPEPPPPPLPWKKNCQLANTGPDRPGPAILPPDVSGCWIYV